MFLIKQILIKNSRTLIECARITFHMKKAELVSIMAEMHNLTKTQASQIVESIFDTIAKKMAEGESVDISGFGKFQGVMTKERMARNPKTGESVKVKAHLKPKFKTAKPLKDLLLGNK